MANSLDDVYRKFGETAEAAQLLETELGTLLFDINAAGEDLFANPNPKRASDLLNEINSSTLGKLLGRLKCKTPIDELEALLVNALAERNRLSHSFRSEERRVGKECRL